jgi:hypothetical protein
MRLWGVRHVRYFWHALRLAYFLSLRHSYGFGMARPEDLKYLVDVWEGKA